MRVDRLIGLHVGGRRIHDGRVETALAFGSKFFDGPEGGEVFGVEGLFLGLDDRRWFRRLDGSAGTHVGDLVVTVIEEGTIGIRPDVLIPPGERMTHVGRVVRTNGDGRREFALRIQKGRIERMAACGRKRSCKCVCQSACKKERAERGNRGFRDDLVHGRFEKDEGFTSNSGSRGRPCRRVSWAGLWRRRCRTRPGAWPSWRSRP